MKRAAVEYEAPHFFVVFVQHPEAKGVVCMKASLFCLFFCWLALTRLAGADAVSWQPDRLEGEAVLVIETPFYAATLLPGRGGRIIRLVDKHTGHELTLDRHSYGGFFDDHGKMPVMPYSVTDPVRVPEGVQILLASSCDGIAYEKRLTFYADSPRLRADYAVANRSQDDKQMLFRNVIRPHGADLEQAKTIYSYARYAPQRRDAHKGVIETHRADPCPEPWAAITSLAAEPPVTAALWFEGHNLHGFYHYFTSGASPTFEYHCDRLPAGKEVRFSVTWGLNHTLSDVDFACPDFLFDLDTTVQDGKLQGRLNLAPLRPHLDTLTFSQEILAADGTLLARLPDQQLRPGQLEKLSSFTFNALLPADAPYIIVRTTVNGPQLDQPRINDTAVAGATGTKTPFAGYRPLAVRRAGENTLRDIPGWQKAEPPYRALPDAADQARGYMVYAETGPGAGRHAAPLDIPLGLNEKESFALHLRSLGYAGEIALAATMPDGVSAELFDTVLVPQNIWARTFNGIKMLPAERITLGRDEDRIVYVRLSADRTTPGPVDATLTFTPEKTEAATLPLRLRFHPVRLPLQPHFSLEVNSYPNTMAPLRDDRGRIDPTIDFDYPLLAAVFRDLGSHLVRAAHMQGTHSPATNPYPRQIRLKDDGQSLDEAIRRQPERFRHRLDLPGLDFGHWDRYFDLEQEAGHNRKTWYAGGLNDEFFLRFQPLTRQIYGQPITSPNDPRQKVIRDWYLREWTGYLRDRGFTRLLGVISDEIGSDVYGAWIIRANDLLAYGMQPTVTQAYGLLANRAKLEIVSPYMRYWVLGASLNLDTLELRRNEGLIRNSDWQTSYSGWCSHWMEYRATRTFGILNAHYGMDAFWVQVYFRGGQGEAAVYFDREGKTIYPSAAWEGVRDGGEDANYFLLCRNLIAALPPAEQQPWRERLGRLSGPDQQALVPYSQVTSSFGQVHQMGRLRDGMLTTPAEADLRGLKAGLLELATALAAVAPVQPAEVSHGDTPLIREGRSCFKLPQGLKDAEGASAYLLACAAGQPFTPPTPEPVKPADPVLFWGNLADFRALLPEAAASMAADLGEHYPDAGRYVMRFFGPAETPSLAVIYGDAEGRAKALRLLPAMVSAPRNHYEHYLLRP